MNRRPIEPVAEGVSVNTRVFARSAADAGLRPPLRPPLAARRRWQSPFQPEFSHFRYDTMSAMRGGPVFRIDVMSKGNCEGRGGDNGGRPQQAGEHGVEIEASISGV